MERTARASCGIFLCENVSLRPLNRELRDLLAVELRTLVCKYGYYVAVPQLRDIYGG
jgi:hypothetical protein